MVREVKEYDERLREILTTARGLFFSKGYDATSVNDIIGAVGIAKGTFYHYFNSKEDLMIALADQITDEAVAIIKDITEDPGLSAREKFQKVYSQVGNWKVANREIFLELMRVMYDPKNNRLLQTLNKMSLKKSAPFFAQIIKQGTREEGWKTRYPDESARIIFHMGFGVAEHIGENFLRLHEASAEEKKRTLDDLYRKTEAYEFAINRLIGTDDKPLDLYDLDLIGAFFEDV